LLFCKCHAKTSQLPPTQLKFMVRAQEVSVLYMYTKFEADSSIHSKVVMGSPNFEIGSRDPGHAHLGVVLWSVCREAPSSISPPNLKRANVYLFKNYWNPKIWKMCHMTSAMPNYRSFYGPIKFEADC